MASNARTYIKFAFCFVLIVSLECRVIKIIEDSDETNDIVVKIILKHKKKENRPKLQNEEEIKLKEILEDVDQDRAESKLQELLEEMKNEMHKKLSQNEPYNEGHEKITNFLSGIDNFEMSKKELPDNLDEEPEDESKDKSISSNLIDKEPPENNTSEFIPKVNARSGIQVGSCPSGFIRRGPLCLPADK